MTQNSALVFDRQLLMKRRNRGAGQPGDHNFLFHEVAERMADRLADISRTFEVGLELGARDGTLGRQILKSGKAAFLKFSDPSEGYVRTLSVNGQEPQQVDEERLPFDESQFDLIISNLSLHWVNDLPGHLIQAKRCLKPDGLFEASIFGGETLTELRQALMTAELEITGGVSPRVSPMVDLRDAAGLLQRAGFALPVADLDRITVSYPNMFKLMAELRAMGEANCLIERLKTPTPRSVFLRAAEIYQEMFSDDEGRISATFEVIYLHGWHPAEGQQKPLPPGSGQKSLKDFL